MRPRRSIIGILAGSLLSLVLLGSSVAGSTIPAPHKIGDLEVGRGYHSTTQLWGGKVLVVGGERERGGLVRRAEFVGPYSGRVRYAGRTPWGVTRHTAIPLPRRRVLIVGGFSQGPGGDSCGRHPALIWSGATKRFRPVKSIPDNQGASATKLKDGRILVAGGGTVCRSGRMRRGGTARSVTWDPETGQATPTGSLARPREHHMAIRLDDGRVLVAGGRICRYGSDFGGCETLSSVEVWDPRDGSWRTVGTAPALYGGRLSRLHDSRIVLTGTPHRDDLDSLWIWDAASGDFVPGTRKPHTIRFGHEPIVLTDGRLAIIGGDRGGRLYRAVNGTRFWDPRSDKWTVEWRPGPPVIGGHSATKVGRGYVVLIGGHAPARGGLRSVSRITGWTIPS